MATSQVQGSTETAVRRAASKVPEVTAYFWIVKILTTGMGETTSDYLAHRLNPVVAVALAGTLLAVSLALQFGARHYTAWKYWTSVTMVSVFGTMAADVLHVALGIPYLISTAFFMAALTLVFAIWYASEGTLSIHGIVTARRELFYWATVMTTFALGTATGDMTAVTVHLGYLASGVMFAILIALPALAYRWLRMNAVFAFWAAYVLTRPLGASFADWMGVSKDRGGLALGTGPVSLVLAVIIAGFVGYLTVSRKDTAR